MNGSLMVKMTEDQQSERIKLDVQQSERIKLDVTFCEKELLEKRSNMVKFAVRNARFIAFRPTA